MRIEVDDLTRAPVLALLEHLLAQARSRGYRALYLETGRHPAFHAAHTLYRGAGFRDCGPFGDDEENGNSMFMKLQLKGASCP